MKRCYKASLSIGMLLGSVAAWSEPPLPKWRDTRESSLFKPLLLQLPKQPPSSVVATAYCGCPLCCGKWSTPEAITASGKAAIQGFTIAADWKVFPENTCLSIQGLGKRTVHDTGSAIKGAKIDVYFDSHEEAKEFGVKHLEVKPC